MFKMAKRRCETATHGKGTLAAKPSGQSAVVVGMNGGGMVRSRLESMGLVPGTMIDILSNVGNGPLLISLGKGRLTLGRGIAEKVLVA